MTLGFVWIDQKLEASVLLLSSSFFKLSVCFQNSVVEFLRF